jgi:hypothetical protein
LFNTKALADINCLSGLFKHMSFPYIFGPAIMLFAFMPGLFWLNINKLKDKAAPGCVTEPGECEAAG